MANGVTTEWFDIHVKLGNYLPLEKVPTREETTQENIKIGESVQKKEIRKENHDDDELDDVEREFYNKRKSELMEFAKKPKFGSLYHVTKEDYVREITEASTKATVIVHLYESS